MELDQSSVLLMMVKRCEEEEKSKEIACVLS
jgi:hypothetical protein